MALEQLTPHLTRQKYREGYMKFLKDEQTNEAMNLGANIQYQSTGESLQSIQNMSSTLSGLSKETLLAVLTARFTGYVQGVRGALMQLPSGQLNFVYVASDLVKEEIAAKFGEDLRQRGGIPASVFRTIVEGLYRGSNISSQVRDPLPPNAPSSSTTTTGMTGSFNSAEGTSDSAGNQLDVVDNSGLQGSDNDPNLFNVAGDNSPTIIVPSLTGTLSLVAFINSTIILYTTPEQRTYFTKIIMDKVAVYKGYRNSIEMMLVEIILFAQQSYTWFNVSPEDITAYARYIGLLSDGFNSATDFVLQGRALFGSAIFNNAIKQLFSTTYQVLDFGAQMLQSQGITIEAALNFGQKAAQELVNMAFSANPEAILNEVVSMAKYGAQLAQQADPMYVASAMVAGQVVASYVADPEAFYNTAKSILYDFPQKNLKYIMDRYPQMREKPTIGDAPKEEEAPAGEKKKQDIKYKEVDSGVPEGVTDSSQGPLTTETEEGWANEEIDLDRPKPPQQLNYYYDDITGDDRLAPLDMTQIGPQLRNYQLNKDTLQTEPVFHPITTPFNYLAGEYMRGFNNAFPGVGRGIKEKKHAYISEKSVPKRKEEFRRFGKHLINVSLLDRNTVSLRSKGGWKIKGCPHKIVGEGVAGVLKSMVENKPPSHEDVLKLNDDEKDYLNKLTANAAVDGFNVPTKRKTEEEKLKHEFEKTRGIIAAGNDNPDLIKDFKRMLVQLIHNKQIPKTQASDVLMELHLLGH